jgi:FKBP-type peptidyl-prolyl cis-trans isomerase
MRIAPLFALVLAAAACTREPTPKATAAGDAGTTPTATATPKDSPATPPKPADNPAGKPPTIEEIPVPPDVAAPPADAEKTPTGIASKVLSKGTGAEHPDPWDEVTVHYTGWTTDGKPFDSSVPKGQPAVLPLPAMIAGWKQGLPLMVIGEKRRFWIPEELAYKGQPNRPKGTLVFDIELVSIKKGEKPTPPPPDVAKAPADAQKTASGLASKVLTKGTGKVKPKDTSIVKFHFIGWNTDGELVDDSSKRKEPMSTSLGSLPPGFVEGLKMMVVGEKRRMWLPPKLIARPGQEPPPFGLTFDIELIEILDLDAPADVKAPPADAEKTASGLQSKVLTKGTGTAKPTPTSKVKVVYTGWTTDGKMFDSSLKRGQPAEFAVTRVIPGWQEALQLMVVGEKRRFWIPEELAYKGKSGPQGMLVFDLELLEIK